MPSHTLPCPTIPRHVLTHPVMPYHTMPCPTLPYPSVPYYVPLCPAIPYRRRRHQHRRYIYRRWRTSGKRSLSTSCPSRAAKKLSARLMNHGMLFSRATHALNIPTSLIPIPASLSISCVPTSYVSSPPISTCKLELALPCSTAAASDRVRPKEGAQIHSRV